MASKSVASRRLVYLFPALDADVLAHPNRKLGFGQAAFGQGDIAGIQFKIIGVQDGAVEHDEGLADHGRRALVATTRLSAARQATTNASCSLAVGGVDALRSTAICR